MEVWRSAEAGFRHQGEEKMEEQEMADGRGGMRERTYIIIILQYII